MSRAPDLSPAAERLLDYLLEDRYRADQYDLHEHLGMSLKTALGAAEELKMKGHPIEVNLGRLTYIQYTETAK